MAPGPPFRKGGRGRSVGLVDYEGFDGAPIAVTDMGAGPPVLLLHGLFSSADVNWVRYGTAARLVAAGYRVIMPDFRGHGRSAAPRLPAPWPADVLALDVEALVRQLEVGHDFVLGGYSLGARTVVRLLARGARPRGAILAGMGLAGIVDADARGNWFIRMIEGRGTWPRGSGEYVAERFMTANVPDPGAIVHLLRAQCSTSAGQLAAIDRPVLLVCGADDDDNGSAADLAAALPRAVLATIPGNHMGSVTRPELAQAMTGWLDAL